MKLKTKILLGYGAALLLALGMGGWGIQNLKRLGRASDAILQENFRSILAAEKTIDALERQDSAILLVMLGDRDVGIEQFREFEIVFLQWFGRAKDNITIPGEAEIIDTLETQYRDYLVAFTQLQAQLIGDNTPDRDVTTAYYYDRVLPAFEAVRQTCLDLLALNQQTMEAASDRAQTLSERAIWSTVALGGATVGVGVVASLLLANRLTRPIEKMTRAAEQIAEGNYDVALPTDSNDELGILAGEMQGMSRKLKAFRELNVGRVIAEKKRSEAIIHSITDGLVVVDEGLRIVAVNPTAAQIFDIDSTAVEDAPFLEAIDDRQLYEYLQTTVKIKQPPRLDADESVRSKESGEKTEYYQLAIAPVKNSKRELLGVVLLLQNVTQLKELDRLKSDFVATASHELRTPLTGMAMSVDLLLETAPAKLSERESELLATTQEDIGRLRALVNDLLDLSKIESGRIDLEFAPVNVMFLINKVIDTFKVQVQEKNVRLALADLPDSLTVNADANKIAWVLTNLVGNALRYTDEGGTIAVNARSGGRWVYICVEDDGPGIPIEYQAKIFDKFVQVKTDRDIGGSGLGLAICKEIVKAHGGTIWVESTPPDGSKFTFTLPAVASSAHPP